MADVNAIQILDENIAKFKALQAPPEDDEEFEAYKDNLEKLIEMAVSDVTQISNYAERVLQRLRELRDRIPEEIRRIKAVVEKKVQAHARDFTERPMSGDSVPGRFLRQMQSIHNIATKTKQLMDSRLAELISETERLFAKIKDGVSLTKGDMDFLKGCTHAWVNSKSKSFEEEKRDEERKEEQKKRKEQEEKHKTEQRRIAEQKAEEKRKKELEEEKKAEIERRITQEKADNETRRRDPNNWKTVIYKDKVDDLKTLSHGIKAAVSFADNEMDEEDIQCLGSDDFDDYKAALDKGEKAVSRIIRINSNKGNMGTEIPFRVFIPHFTPDTQGEEVVIKQRVNEGQWVTTEVMQATENVKKTCGSYDVTLAGVELRDVTSCMLVAVTRPAKQTFIVNEQEALIGSDVDSSVQVQIQEGTFQVSSSIELKVQPIRQVGGLESMPHDDRWKHIQSATPMVSIICATPPAKHIKVAFSDVHQIGRKSASRRVHLCQTDDSGWRLADVEYRASTGTTLLLLLPYRTSYRVIDIGIDGDMSDKDALKVILSYLKVINATSQPANGTVVKIILRQKSENPKDAILLVSKSHLVDKNKEQLESSGYDIGPEPSKEVCLSEGQIINITSEGCADLSQVDQDKLNPKFFAYMNQVNLHLSIAYQKDFRAIRFPSSREPYDGYIVASLKSESGEPLDTVRLGVSFQGIQESDHGGMHTAGSHKMNSSKVKKTKPQLRKK